MNKLFPAQLKCLPHSVYVVGVSLSTTPYQENLIEFLSPTEKNRAEKFKFRQHRERYIVFHAALRQILARCMQCSPNALVFYEGEHGKPMLDKKYDLQFNLTHSEDEAIIALTLKSAIGVDIEKITEDRDHQKIAARFFSNEENAYLNTLPLAAQSEAFYTLWTLKESFIKATGKGISQGLQSFSVNLNTLSLLRCEGYDPGQWTLSSFSWKPGFMSAFATEQKHPTVHFFEFERLIMTDGD